MGLLNIFKKIGQPRNSAAFATINLLLGVGPIIVPQSFFRAGIFFSIMWTVVICFLNYLSGRYVGQSILLINKHKDQQSFASGQDRSLPTSQNTSILSQQQPVLRQKKITSFDHVEQIRYLYGEKWRYMPSIAIVIYLFGVAVSKCIMTGKTLSRLFDGVPVLEAFEFWLALFFLSGSSFSFKSIQKTKWIQATMIFVRLLSVILMIIGALVIIGQNGSVQDLAPVDGNAFFNGSYFGDIFSNLIFAFIFHHSMPALMKQLTDMKQVQSFLNIGFFSAGITMLIIPITAVMAFGNELVNNRKGMLGQSHSLIYYNQDFKGRIDFIYYFISFYVFLNIAAFSVYIIVLRRNLLSMIAPTVNPDRLSKTTIISTSVTLGIVLVVAFALKEYIQIALNFSGGILGCMIMFVIPGLEIIGARKLFPPQKSFLNSSVWVPYVIVTLGFMSIVFNLYETIYQLTK